MATLPKYVNILSQSTGVSEATLAHVGRVIREGGLIETTQRGRGAKHLDANNVSALLIASALLNNDKDLCEKVRRYWGLKTDHEAGNTQHHIEIPDGLKIDYMVESLGTALLGVLTAPMTAVEITMRLDAPYEHARLGLQWNHDRKIKRATFAYVLPFIAAASSYGDRDVEVEIGARTFRCMRALLAGQEGTMIQGIKL